MVKNFEVIGNFIHCPGPFQMEVLEQHCIRVENSKIISVLPVSEREGSTDTVRLTDTQLLIPGLIDGHIHAPQYPNAGLGYDKPLLDWLQTYTFPLEKKYGDLQFSREVYNAVVNKTLSSGTTTACYFASMFKDSSLELVEAVIESGQRAFVGKINMTQSSPDDYIETPEKSIADTEKFVDAVRSKGNSLVEPIITPRFALSVDENMMSKLGEMAEKKNLHIQTHISENKTECEIVNSTYHKAYAQVYDDAGLLTPKTILAHGIYLTDDECRLLAKRGTSVAHCPDSNTWLGSGLCDVKRLLEFGISVGLGTDVAGGASPSIINSMRSALEVSMHLSFNKEEYSPLTWKDVFYLATSGGAKALSLDRKIGNFLPGNEFDALVIDIDVKNGPSDCLGKYSPLEMLQKFIYTGDDRNVKKVYVAGKLVKSLQ